MKEIWKDIKGYEGLYQISNSGHVRSVTHSVLMKNGRYKTVYSRMLVLHEGGNNKYLQAYLHKDCKVKNFLVHRLVTSHFISPIPNKMEVNHKDGNKQNNHVDNLEIVTRSENIQHAMRTGLMDVFGEKQGAAKLSNEQVAVIRHLWNTYRIPQPIIANMYGVSQGHISVIVNYKAFNHESCIVSHKEIESFNF